MNTASVPVSTIISTIEKPLAAYYQDDMLAQQYAWWLLSALTGKTKASLLALSRVTMSAADYQALQQWVVDLTVLHKPIAYILGSMPFCDLTIHVESPILIPRPETEEWVSNLIEQLRPLQNTPLNILDIGTGTGCIALALAYALPEARVIGVDVSAQALQLAQENGTALALDNVTFMHSDLFLELPESMYFDLIVSNPPYISAEEWQDLDQSVRAWEDHTALVSDEEGLGMLKKISNYAPNYLKSNEELAELGIANLWLEIGHEQGNAVAAHLREQGYVDVKIEKDLMGRDRVVKGRFNGIVWNENELL